MGKSSHPEIAKQSSCTAGQEGLLASMCILVYCSSMSRQATQFTLEVRVYCPSGSTIAGLLSGLHLGNLHMLHIK